MKSNKIIVLFCILATYCGLANSHSSLPTGSLFTVSAKGKTGITLCLNGKGHLSCQRFNVPGQFVVKTTHPSKQYSYAGIKIDTLGVSIADLGISCTPYPQTGYCLFSVSQTQGKQFNLTESATKVAVGSFFKDVSKGMLAVKQGANATWSFPVPGGYTFIGTSCTGSGSNAGQEHQSLNS